MYQKLITLNPGDRVIQRLILLRQETRQWYCKRKLEKIEGENK